MLLLALSLFARSRPSHHSVQDVAPHNRAVRFAGRPPPASAPSAGGADAFVPAGGIPPLVGRAGSATALRECHRFLTLRPAKRRAVEPQPGA